MMLRKEVIFSVLFVFVVSFISAFEFAVVSQSDFDQGNYTFTEFNTTGNYLQLSPGNTLGNYTSKIFDGDDLSQWQTLVANMTLVTEPFLVVVDNKDDVWTSRDGVAWLLVKDNYNSADGGGDDSQFAFADYNNTLYSIENDDDVWVSFDKGMNWTKVNDDYNNEGQHVERATADYNNNLYLIESDEDVWQSTNGGVNWTKINGSDFNGGNGDVKGMVVNSSNMLFVVDASEDVWTSGDGIAWTLVADDLNGGETSDASYLAIDSNDSLYVIENDDDIWQSTNNGVNWTKINDDYNGENDHVVRSMFDYQNTFYLIEDDDDVWVSFDKGMNWTKINGSDFNGGNGDPAGFMALNVTTNVTFAVRSCASSDCSDGTFTATGETLNLGNARYFQFLLTLTADANELTPQIFNVSLTYADVGAPSVSGAAPSSGNFTVNTTVEINATVTDGKQVSVVLANLTLPNGTSNLLTLANTSASLYTTSYVASAVGDYTFAVLANDTSNNLNDSRSGAFSIYQQGSGGSGSSSQNSLSSNAVQGDSGPDALRNAPPGTPVIGKQPQPRLPSPRSEPSTPTTGTPVVQQPRPSETNPLTGAAVGTPSGSGMTFTKISLFLLILALLAFTVSYVLRERRVATKHLNRKLQWKKAMRQPDLLDKLQGYVSAEILDRLKKGDVLQQHKPLDPSNKEFAHQFPEVAKEIQQHKIHVHPKVLDYARVAQTKKEIYKDKHIISPTDMKKIFPETLGKVAHLRQERFILTPRIRQVHSTEQEPDFSTHYVVKPVEKSIPAAPKPVLQAHQKISKVHKGALLKGLQEVYKLE